VGPCGVLFFVLRIEEREAPSVSSCEALALLNPTGESQGESIARLHRVAKSPTPAALPVLSSSQPETLA
jgi:hypothetical protein